MTTDGPSEIHLTGDLDIATRGEVLQLADYALSRPGITDLVVDLAGVTFLDSSGIGSLVQTRNKAFAAGATMRVVNPGRHVYATLHRVGLTQVFGLTPRSED